MQTDLSVAHTIRNQLGVGTLLMLGAQTLTGSSDSLGFRIRGSRKVSHISVRLGPSDTYTVEFIKCGGGTRKVVESCPDIYADSLHDCIQRVTGLETRMPQISGVNCCS